MPPPAYDWQGDWQSCEVLFPSRLHGSTLYGVLFAPGDQVNEGAELLKLAMA